MAIPIPPFLWKIGAALAVCAGLLFWGYSKGVDTERARQNKQLMDANLRAARAELKAAQASSEASRTARTVQDVRQAAIDETWAKAQRLYANRAPVPAVCPSPDAQLMRDMADASGRIGKTGDRLRGLSAADDAGAKAARR